MVFQGFLLVNHAHGDIFEVRSLENVNEVEWTSPWVIDDSKAESEGDTKSAFKKLFELLLDDTEGAALINKAKQRLPEPLNTREERLLSITKFCEASGDVGNVARYGTYFIESREGAPFKFNMIPSVQNKIDTVKNQEPLGAQIIVVETGPIKFTKLAYAPTLCIRKNISLFKALGVLFHELTHFSTRPDFYSVASFDLDLLKNWPQIQDVFLQRPGEELEAVIAEMQFFQRLSKRSSLINKWRELVLANFFKLDGTLEDKNGLKFFLLNDLNYSEHYFKEFTDLVNFEIDLNNSAINTRNTIVQKLNDPTFRLNRPLFLDYVKELDTYINSRTNHLKNLKAVFEKNRSDPNKSI